MLKMRMLHIFEKDFAQYFDELKMYLSYQNSPWKFLLFTKLCNSMDSGTYQVAIIVEVIEKNFTLCKSLKISRQLLNTCYKIVLVVNLISSCS